MIKQVAVLKGQIKHIYHTEDDKTFIEGATIEQRDFEYSEENGWREVGYEPSPSEVEILKRQLQQIQEEKNALAETLDMILVDVLPALMP